MKLEEFKVYQASMQIGEEVWSMVGKWDYFSKDTIGKQLVRSTDSIAANLSEGFGRYHYNESKHFSYYARGSLFETKTWLAKAYNRKMISEEDYKRLINNIEITAIKLNKYINSIGIPKSQPITDGEA